MAQLPFVVIFLLFPTIIANVEIEQLHFSSLDSSIEYETYPYQSSEPMKLIIKFDPNKKGRILTVIFKDKAEPSKITTILTVDVGKERVMVRAGLGTTFSNIQEESSDTYTYTLRIYLEDQQIKTEFDTVSYTNKFSITPGQQFDLSFIFGQYLGNQSIIGCVESKISINNQYHVFKVLKEKKVEKKCPTPCNKGELKCKNGGSCKDVTLTTSACDCYGTDFVGDVCDKGAPTAVLKSSKDIDQFIGYNLDKHDNPTRVAFDFKPYQYVPQRQDLFYAMYKMTTGTWQMKIMNGEMKAYYEDNYFTFETADGFASEKFKLDPMEGRWHSFVLNLDYDGRLLRIMLDKEERTVGFGGQWLLTFITSMEDDWRKLKFVQPNSLGGGCLKNVYVDHFSVLEMVINKNKKAVSSKDIEFGECPIKTSAASILSKSLFMCMVLMLFNLL